MRREGNVNQSEANRTKKSPFAMQKTTFSIVKFTPWHNARTAASTATFLHERVTTANKSNTALSNSMLCPSFFVFNLQRMLLKSKTAVVRWIEEGDTVLQRLRNDRTIYLLTQRKQDFMSPVLIQIYCANKPFARREMS